VGEKVRQGLQIIPGTKPGETAYKIEEGDTPEEVARFVSALAPDRLLKLEEVESLVGMKKSRIFELIGEGAFPAQIKQGRSSLWSEKKIQAWIREQVAR